MTHGSGSSFDFYDPMRSVDREGQTTRNRITWYDSADGTVRQHGQVSHDGGATWQDNFDGLYRKRATAVPATPGSPP